MQTSSRHAEGAEGAEGAEVQRCRVAGPRLREVVHTEQADTGWVADEPPNADLLVRRARRLRLVDHLDCDAIARAPVVRIAELTAGLGNSRAAAPTLGHRGLWRSTLPYFTCGLRRVLYFVRSCSVCLSVPRITAPKAPCPSGPSTLYSSRNSSLESFCCSTTAPLTVAAMPEQKKLQNAATTALLEVSRRLGAAHCRGNVARWCGIRGVPLQCARTELPDWGEARSYGIEPSPSREKRSENIHHARRGES